MRRSRRRRARVVLLVSEQTLSLWRQPRPKHRMSEERSEGTSGGGRRREVKVAATKKRRENQNKHKNKNRREKKKAAAEAEAAAVGMEDIVLEVKDKAAVMPLTTETREENVMTPHVVEVLTPVMMEEAAVSSALNGERKEIEKEGVVVSVSVKPAAVAPKDREEEEEEEVVTAERGDKDGAERVLNSIPDDLISTPLTKQRKRKKSKKGGVAAATKTTIGTMYGEEKGAEAATPTAPK